MTFQRPTTMIELTHNRPMQSVNDNDMDVKDDEMEANLPLIDRTSTPN